MEMEMCKSKLSAIYAVKLLFVLEEESSSFRDIESFIQGWTSYS